MGDDKVQVPEYGFKLRLDHVFPEKWRQTLRPRLSQLWDFIPLGIRYFIYSIYIWCKGRKPLMDYLHCIDGKQMYGVPLGGIGSGSIGRGFRGEFCRYQLRPGDYQYKTMYGNQFILSIWNSNGDCVYQKVLNTGGPPKSCLKSWDWNFDGRQAEYSGLYPRSWTVYHIPEHSLRVTCKQVSPVIPHNYKDSCIPGSVFVWTVENEGPDVKDVGVTLTFQNGTGERSDRKGGCWSELFKVGGKGGNTVGVLIHHVLDLMNYTFGISALERDGVTVSYLKNWNPLGSGKEIWNLLKGGGLKPFDPDPSPPTGNGQQLGGAVCARVRVPGKSSSNLEFNLVWDMPRVHFGLNRKQYWKYYTRHFGRKESARKLAVHCFESYQRWESDIDEWQRPVLTDPDLPDWYKSALFNETYFVSDGGTIWLDVDDDEKTSLPADDPRREYGHFAYLEGHEYRMYNTYDVHFYASFALSMLWPHLQSVLQRDFCDTIREEDRSRQWHLFNGGIGYRKVKNSMPHDLGDPCEEPFLKINAYPIHDVSEWRDLDLKFVLQSYRDYSLTADLNQLKYVWDNVRLLMNEAMRWDKDGDGLIENQGEPDQTYDTWTMTGPSSYCGGLWLAALQCTCEMASLLSDHDTRARYEEVLARAKKSFHEKLWNGLYFNFDCSRTLSRTIMSDQLCGLWYIRMCGLENKILQPAAVTSALRTIFENNVMKFYNGTMGAVNGMHPDGTVDRYTLQSEEIWVGVVYALASLMIHEGMVDEGWKTAEGIYETVYKRIGMGFETPEALHEDKKYRAIGYMRPLSIWSVQLAWTMRNKGLKDWVKVDG